MKDKPVVPKKTAFDVPDISDIEEARVQAEIVADPEHPDITDDEAARMRPATEVLPATLYAALVARSRGRPKLDHPKVAVKLRLDSATVAAFKATGPGWQTRINAVLAAAALELRNSMQATKQG